MHKLYQRIWSMKTLEVYLWSSEDISDSYKSTFETNQFLWCNALRDITHQQQPSNIFEHVYIYML